MSALSPAGAWPCSLGSCCRARAWSLRFLRLALSAASSRSARPCGLLLPAALVPGHWLLSPSGTRDNCRSSYQTEPETSCSEAERAARSSRTSWARQSASGTVKAISNSVHLRSDADEHGPLGQRRLPAAGTRDAPLQAARAAQLALERAFEAIVAGRQQDELGDALELDAAGAELQQQRVLVGLVGPRRDVDRHARRPAGSPSRTAGPTARSRSCRWRGSRWSKAARRKETAARCSRRARRACGRSASAGRRRRPHWSVERRSP